MVMPRAPVRRSNSGDRSVASSASFTGSVTRPLRPQQQQPRRSKRRSLVGSSTRSLHSAPTTTTTAPTPTTVVVGGEASSDINDTERRQVRLRVPPPDFLRSHSEASRERLWASSADKEKKLAKRQWSQRTAATQSMKCDSNFSLQYNPEDEFSDEEQQVEAARSMSDMVISTGATEGQMHGQGSRESTTPPNHPAGIEAKSTNDRQNLCLLWVTAFRDFCGYVVNDERVQLLIVIMIVLNAIMMGIATFDFIENNTRANIAFDTADNVFLIIFTIELILQFIYHGLHLFLDGWLLFDFLIVVLSWSLQSVQIVRAFRIFRAFRLITRLNVLKNLVLALFAVAPSMGAIIALLVLILYIYAVMCTDLFRDLQAEGYTDANYFGSLDASLFTLFQMMTLEWADIVRQVMDKYYWAWAVFSSFLVMTSFILYSLIIAVVCDAVKVTEHHDEMAEHVREKEETRQRIFTLEQRVSDMAAQQSLILENLHKALQELQATDEDDDGDSSQESSSSEAEDEPEEETAEEQDILVDFSQPHGTIAKGPLVAKQPLAERRPKPTRTTSTDDEADYFDAAEECSVLEFHAGRSLDGDLLASTEDLSCYMEPSRGYSHDDLGSTNHAVVVTSHDEDKGDDDDEDDDDETSEHSSQQANTYATMDSIALRRQRGAMGKR